MSVSFGPFNLIRRLAVTGLAEVFVAERKRGGERVAVKRLLPHAQEDQEIVSLFLSEAALAQTLQHPNVVRVLDYGRVGHSPYIEQELLEGITLSRLAKELQAQGQGLDERVVAVMAFELAKGLAYIHGAKDEQGQALNIVHRDLTPGNIMLTASGTIKILDFGIATYRGRKHLTQPGIRKGKAAYMSPEQVRGDDLDFRSDIFAFGVVLIEFALGSRLFKEDDILRTLERIEAVDIPAPSSQESLLEKLLRRCLSRDRNLRPDLVTEIIPFMTGNLKLNTDMGVEVLTEVFERYGANWQGLSGSPVGSNLPVSAEERGEETTDQKEITDITLMGESPLSQHFITKETTN